jgi:hypothetical protein
MYSPFLLIIYFVVYWIKNYQRGRVVDVSYVSDVKGNQTAVIIGIDEWQKIIDKQKKMKAKLDLLTGLQEAVQEINLMKESQTKRTTFKEFLNEN